MSSLSWLIILCIVASIFGTVAYLLIIKHYYWKGSKYDPSRKKEK